MRKIRFIVLTVLLTSILSLGVNAQEDSKDLDNFKFGHTLYRSMSASKTDNPLAFLSDSITDGGGYLCVCCSTYSTMECDELELNIEIQKLVGDYWKTVETYNVSKENTQIFTHIDTLYDVEIGAKYRLQTMHLAKVNNITYTDMITSSTIVAE